MIAYIDAARKNRVACPTGDRCDARLRPPLYRITSNAAKTVGDVECAVDRFIRAETYVRERMGCAQETIPTGDREDDLDDMPALESFTHY